MTGVSSQVFAVVREQIVRALANNSSQGNFDSFRQRLSHLTYQDIVILWQQDRRNREELESQAKPIVYSIHFCLLFCFFLSFSRLHNCIRVFKYEMVLMWCCLCNRIYGSIVPFTNSGGLSCCLGHF